MISKRGGLKAVDYAKLQCLLAGYFFVGFRCAQPNLRANFFTFSVVR